MNARHRSIAEKLLLHGAGTESRVLEIGCGIGTLSGLIADVVPNGEALCVDISDASIAEARSTYAMSANLRFEVANAVTFDFGDQTFDVIVLPDVLEHIPVDQHPQLFRRLAPLLNVDGFIFIHIPNPYHLEWCQTHRPELLQIIDQPIFTDQLTSSIYPSGLHIHALQSYSIWLEDCDYQYIVVKKNGYENFERRPSTRTSMWTRVLKRLRASLTKE